MGAGSPRNIVVCCDGTANQISGDHTNVLKLFLMLDHVSEEQRNYYHPGIGTAPFTGPWNNFLAQTFGRGIHADILDILNFLSHCYQPGDRLFLFGFSRGAYTVRAVASMLKFCGIARPGHENLESYLIKLVTGISSSKNPSEAAPLFDSIRVLQPLIGIPCKPWFVGVWDTVVSLLGHWSMSFPAMANNPDIQIVRQALAIDEKRAFFRTALFLPGPPRIDSSVPPQDIKQVWFAGVHKDVGGGYPEQESGLAKISLEWMVAEAMAAGLKTNATRVAEVLGRLPGSSFVSPSSLASAHESLDRKWLWAEFVPKLLWNTAKRRWEHGMNLFRKRVIPPGSLIHRSVLERGADYCKRLPPGYVIEEWSANSGHREA